MLMSGWGRMGMRRRYQHYMLSVAAVSPHSPLITQPSWCRWPVRHPPRSAHRLAALIISAHSVANFVLSSISVVAGMLCWLSPGSSRPARRFRYEKDAFCTDALIGGIIKYWNLVQSRIFGEKFGKSGMWANQLSPHLLELSTFVVAVSSVPLNPQLQRGNGKKWWSF